MQPERNVPAKTGVKGQFVGYFKIILSEQRHRLASTVEIKRGRHILAGILDLAQQHAGKPEPDLAAVGGAWSASRVSRKIEP